MLRACWTPPPAVLVLPLLRPPIGTPEAALRELIGAVRCHTLHLRETDVHDEAVLMWLRKTGGISRLIWDRCTAPPPPPPREAGGTFPPSHLGAAVFNLTVPDDGAYEAGPDVASAMGDWVFRALVSAMYLTTMAGQRLVTLAVTGSGDSVMRLLDALQNRLSVLRVLNATDRLTVSCALTGLPAQTKTTGNDRARWLHTRVSPVLGAALRLCRHVHISALSVKDAGDTTRPNLGGAEKANLLAEFDLPSVLLPDSVQIVEPPPLVVRPPHGGLRRANTVPTQ